MPDDQQDGPTTAEGPVAPAPAPAATKGSIPTSTVVVGALLVLVVGFGLGFFAGHARRLDRFDHSMTQRHLGGDTGMPVGGSGSVGMGPTGGAAFAPTAMAGTVTGIDGDTVTIRTFRGETVAVHVSSVTQVRVSQIGSLSDLSPGSSIVVIGQPDGAGGFAAVRVIEGAMTTGG